MLRKSILQLAKQRLSNYHAYNSSRFYCKSHSEYPDAIDPSKVDNYQVLAKPGAGEVYQHVLEYRVWFPN